MKKICAFILALFMIMLNISPASAENIIKSYYTYTILNKKIDEFLPVLDSSLDGESGVVKLDGTTNAYYATYLNEHYYIKVYPANNNTDLYIVSDAEYSKDDNAATEFFKKNNFRYKKLDDKTALKEYRFDFIEYARTGKLNGMFTMPDYIKPLKTGMGKINDKISKNSKKTSAIPYSVDREPIDLTCVNTQTFVNEEAQVTVTIKEYRMKNKQNKYAHAYEYLITNNAASDIVIDKVTSERLASMKDITTQTFVDLDRLDLVDTVGSFPPVVVCTCGLSLLASVPNWVRLAKVTKESVRYAHTLPENYTIKGNSKMRILVMKFKNDPKTLNFTATRNGATYYFSY